MPPRPGLKRPGLFLCYSAAKMQKFFDALFDTAYNIFLYVDKKDRRSYPKMQGPRRSFLHENPHKIYRRGESVTEGKFGNCIVLLSIGATIEGVGQIEIRSLTSISVQQR